MGPPWRDFLAFGMGIIPQICLWPHKPLLELENKAPMRGSLGLHKQMLAKHKVMEWVPSGNLTKRYWKWWFIVDLPIENGDFP